MTTTVVGEPRVAHPSEQFDLQHQAARQMKWVLHGQRNRFGDRPEIAIQFLPPLAVAPIDEVVETDAPEAFIPIEEFRAARLRPAEEGRVKRLGLRPPQLALGEIPGDRLAAAAIDRQQYATPTGVVPADLQVAQDEATRFRDASGPEVQMPGDMNLKPHVLDRMARHHDGSVRRGKRPAIGAHELQHKVAILAVKIAEDLRGHGRRRPGIARAGGELRKLGQDQRPDHRQAVRFGAGRNRIREMRDRGHRGRELGQSRAGGFFRQCQRLAIARRTEELRQSGDRKCVGVDAFVAAHHAAVLSEHQGPPVAPWVPAVSPAKRDDSAGAIQPAPVGRVDAVHAAEDPDRPPLAPQPLVAAENRPGIIDARAQSALRIEGMTLPKRQDVFEEMPPQPRGHRRDLARAEAGQSLDTGGAGIGVGRQHP
jgi:hypothetical protein